MFSKHACCLEDEGWFFKCRLKKHKRKPPTCWSTIKCMIECYHDRKPLWACIPLLLTIKVSMSCIFLFTRSLAIAPHLWSTCILFSSDLLHIHPKMGRDSMQFVLTVYESYNKPYILYYEENCIFFCVQNKNNF